MYDGRGYRRRSGGSLLRPYYPVTADSMQIRNAKPLRSATIPVALGVAALAGMALGGCSSGAMTELPTWAGGLPAEAPARPAETAAYPAVHDVPAPRPETTLSEDEQQRLARDLANARERNARGLAPARPARPAGASTPR
jgi:hypothetical protein